ncbi:hypothetical protein RI685_16385 (plasmid) [Clavibacter michiganensis]|uniref:hypothetical protein n=1 Tax=Clavibacter michiganensis TaxID=28447 RepID=UPI003DA06CCE
MEVDLENLVWQYRTGADPVETIAQRLAKFGVTVDDLRTAVGGDLTAYVPVDELFDVDRLHRAPAELTDEELMRIAVLAEERIAALRRQVTVASRVRHTAIRRAAARTSVVDISRRLGISRQKVSQIVNDSDVTEYAAMALSYLARSIRGER